MKDFGTRGRGNQHLHIKRSKRYCFTNAMFWLFSHLSPQFFLQTKNSRASRHDFRTKKRLGFQFVQSLTSKLRAQTNDSNNSTPPPKRTKWDGRKARQKLRGEGAHDSGVVVLDASTAISLFSPGIKGAYVHKKSGCCVDGKWEQANPRTKSDIVNHVVDAVHHVAKSFCPQDSHSLVSQVFRDATPPTCRDATRPTHDGYHQWSKGDLIQLMLHEYINAKKSFRRKQILSWVSSTKVKKKWIKKLFGVSYGTIRTAQRHAFQWTPGGDIIRLTNEKQRYKPSARAKFLKKWIDFNVECDPAGRNKLRRIRFLKRHSGHQIYAIDSVRAGLKPFCRTHFYNHPLQSGISNTQVHAGLCSICTRWGQMGFQALLAHAIEINMLLKTAMTFDIDLWKTKFKKVSVYFTRGGMFQRSLKPSCNNKHCCMSFALSHPTIEEFQHECDHGTTCTHHHTTHTNEWLNVSE